MSVLHSLSISFSTATNQHIVLTRRRFVWDDLKVLLGYQLSQVVQRYEDASAPENLELHTKISKLLNDYTEYDPLYQLSSA